MEYVNQDVKLMKNGSIINVIVYQALLDMEPAKNVLLARQLMVDVFVIMLTKYLTVINLVAWTALPTATLIKINGIAYAMLAS